MWHNSSHIEVRSHPVFVFFYLFLYPTGSHLLGTQATALEGHLKLRGHAAGVPRAGDHDFKASLHQSLGAHQIGLDIATSAIEVKVGWRIIIIIIIPTMEIVLFKEKHPQKHRPAACSIQHDEDFPGRHGRKRSCRFGWEVT